MTNHTEPEHSDPETKLGKNLTNGSTMTLPKDDFFSRIWPVLLAAFGLLFFLTGLALLIREIEFGRQAVQANGSIVEVRVSDSGDGPNYTPIVEFRVPDGETIRFEGISTSPKPIQGELVLVLYRKNSPRDARIDSFVQRWLFPTIFLPLGTLLLMVGVTLRRGRSPTCN